MRFLFNILGVVFAVLFLTSAVLQYNDPDPLIWILIYGVAATLSILYVVRKVNVKILLGVVFIAFLGFLYMYPDKFEGFEIGKGDIKNVEEAREAFGLLIIAIVFGILALGSRNRK